MASPIRKLTEALTGTDVPSAEARAVAARQQTIDAAASVDTAKAARTAADETGDAGAIQAAEASVIAAERNADRATRALTLAENKLQRAKQAASAAELGEARKRLAGYITARDKAGKTIEDALQALEHGVKTLAEIDTDIASIPTGVLGPNYVQGHNGGKAAMDRQITVELQQRGIQGRPSSVALPSFSDWLATGTELLRGRV